MPGSILLFGTLFYFSELRQLMGSEGVSVGGLGIFLIVAYALGHALAGAGNLLEVPYWRLFGGLPSLWVFKENQSIVPSWQYEKIRSKLATCLGFEAHQESSTRENSRMLVREIYSYVEKFGEHERIDIFNGNYGLSRGLSVAFLALAVLSICVGACPLAMPVALLAVSILFWYRMHRFGVRYAQELFVQFLLATEVGETAPKRLADH
ncbi:MAG TPA: hypothetical protein VN656_14165 [Stellaceae bacterium]|nr:hypothetical protein [Stellaceae bacterium]